jgi:hypothetical protein
VIGALDAMAVSALVTELSQYDAGPGGAREGGTGLMPTDVRNVVMAHVGAVRACYELEVQKTPDLKGNMRVAWRIDPDGSAKDVKVVESTLNNARVESCVARQVAHWTFPRAGAPTVVASYPFKFGVAP